MKRTTPTRPRQRLAAACCALALLAPPPPLGPAAQAQVSLPALGDTASDDFDIGTERRLGDEIMREIRPDPDYLDDPVLLEYLQSIWQPLIAAARERGEIGADLQQRFAYEPFLVRDRSVNAFALPGGFVGVHLGLIAMTASRDELASVLAHEMTHVNQRHIARGIVNSKRLSLINIASTILGVLAAAKSRSADAANAVLVGGQAASIQGQLNFSRDMEREADRIGFQVMTAAGFSPGGMAAMFDKLQTASRLNDFGGYPYLRSHPLTTERIGEARARMGTGGAHGAAPVASTAAGPPAAGALEHTAAQARSRVLMDTRVDALRHWQAQDGDANSPATSASANVADRLAATYESALASTLLHDWPRADASLQRAQALAHALPPAEARTVRAVDLLVAQSALERGDSRRARAVLEPYADEASRPVTMLLAQVALRGPAVAAVPAGGGLGAPTDAASAQPASPAGSPSPLRQSAERLQTWVALHPADADAWALLGRVWAQAGQPLRALRAEAESRLALGDLVGAIDRLRAGQRLARNGGAVDFIESSVIDSRVRTLEVKRRQQVADERTRGG